ncbi:MAG: hypothetical protein ACI9DC_002299 [Gammaproteobacteria bacterium]|jgi:hypothetical protein
MSEEQFEIALLGTIREGADVEAVKARIGKMFNADSAKVEQLLSGQRVVIKKNVDQQTAEKYKSALHGAGAECEVRSLSDASPDAAAPAAGAVSTAAAAPASQAPPSAPAESPAAELAPPKTDPLGITADQINDLSATLAPVGSELQSEVKVVPEPQYDLSGLEMAPVGSTLGDEKKELTPPIPDTSGLSLAD